MEISLFQSKGLLFKGLIMLISHLFNLVLYMFNTHYISHFYRYLFTSANSLSLVLVGWRATSHHLLRCSQLVVILLSKLSHPILSVQFLSNLLVCTHKLVNLSRQLVILVRDDTDVVVHAVDFDL